MKGLCGDRHLSKIEEPKEPEWSNVICRGFSNFSNLKDSQLGLPGMNKSSRGSSRGSAN